MNSTSELKDAHIANEIQRISRLSHEELVSELIELRSRVIEQMSDYEIIHFHHARESQ